MKKTPKALEKERVKQEALAEKTRLQEERVQAWVAAIPELNNNFNRPCCYLHFLDTDYCKKEKNYRMCSPEIVPSRPFLQIPHISVLKKMHPSLMTNFPGVVPVESHPAHQAPTQRPPALSRHSPAPSVLQNSPALSRRSSALSQHSAAPSVDHQHSPVPEQPPAPSVLQHSPRSSALSQHSATPSVDHQLSPVPEQPPVNQQPVPDQIIGPSEYGMLDAFKTMIGERKYFASSDTIPTSRVGSISRYFEDEDKFDCYVEDGRYANCVTTFTAQCVEGEFETPLVHHYMAGGYNMEPLTVDVWLKINELVRELHRRGIHMPEIIIVDGRHASIVCFMDIDYTYPIQVDEDENGNQITVRIRIVMDQQHSFVNIHNRLVKPGESRNILTPLGNASGDHLDSAMKRLKNIPLQTKAQSQWFSEVKRNTLLRNNRQLLIEFFGSHNDIRVLNCHSEESLATWELMKLLEEYADLTLFGKTKLNDQRYERLTRILPKIAQLADLNSFFTKLDARGAHEYS